MNPPPTRSYGKPTSTSVISHSLYWLLLFQYYHYTLRIYKVHIMDSRSSFPLIPRVIVALVLAVATLLALMAARAGVVEITPGRVYMGIFILVVGGAFLSMIRLLLAVPAQRDEQVTAEVDGSN